ncbi:hypothetical protein [Noviherbaspirillum suwonense]|uniref:hypothetical protein n=1 Tax=Noviherbaspirillum suwonense TaxID=1224511 RepID=UPI0024B8009F|nr:hypothetical protein [Noviherbaspirillum suwonense]
MDDMNRQADFATGDSPDMEVVVALHAWHGRYCVANVANVDFLGYAFQIDACRLHYTGATKVFPKKTLRL